MQRNPESPWNPAYPVEVTPDEYEQQVVEWLSRAGSDLKDFHVRHRTLLLGSAGEYEFDAVAEFTILGGARLVLLVECKRWRRPVDREVLLGLDAKLRDVGAHKAMVVSTCGFQKGALDYAAGRGIATVTFIDGRWLYETKSLFNQSAEPPPWIRSPRFAGQLLSVVDGRICAHLVDEQQVDAIRGWLCSSP